MTSRRILVAAIGSLSLLAVGCSSESSSSGTTTPTSEVTTTVAETTTTVAAPTTTVADTTTTAPATTTTIPAVVGLTLSAQGIGDALFDADAEGVIDYVHSILGEPTSDTGWVDPTTLGGVCGGTQVRLVDWNDLSLYFTDEITGVPHFASYSYGEAFGPVISPFGLATEAGIGVGSTVAQLRGVYPTAVVNPDDGIGGSTFLIEPGLAGLLTGTTDADTIKSFVGGSGCGE